MAAQKKLDVFRNIDFSFGGSREAQFVEDLMKAISDYDIEQFSQVCFDYDKIYKLDAWKTTLLVRMKRNLQAEAGEGDEPDLT